MIGRRIIRFLPGPACIVEGDALHLQDHTHGSHVIPMKLRITTNQHLFCVKIAVTDLAGDTWEGNAKFMLLNLLRVVEND